MTVFQIGSIEKICIHCLKVTDTVHFVIAMIFPNCNYSTLTVSREEHAL